MAKPKKERLYAVDLLELQIVHVYATSKTDACKRVDKGEGDLVQRGVDTWSAGPRYCHVIDTGEEDEA